MLGAALSGLRGHACTLAAVALALIAFASAWKAQSWRYEAKIAAIQSAQALALAQAESHARSIEAKQQRQLEDITHETEQKLAAVVRAERAAADERVRSIAARYAARQRQAANNSAAAHQCAPDDARARVLADLLGELDELAQVYAREADARRVAGLACQAGFDALREQDGNAP